MLKAWICLLTLTAATASAQWDVGVTGGFGLYNNLTLKNANASATAGFSNGGVVGVYGGEDLYRYFGGELNYLYRQDNLKLSGNGQSESFAAHSHLITYDTLFHFKPKESRLRPFVSAGFGLQIIVSNGDESKPQPLGATCFAANATCFGALTATHELEFVGEVGAGVKFQINKHLRLRVQVKDYLGPLPDQVIAPGPGATLSGFLNGITATGALGVNW